LEIIRGRRLKASGQALAPVLKVLELLSFGSRIRSLAGRHTSVSFLKGRPFIGGVLTMLKLKTMIRCVGTALSLILFISFLTEANSVHAQSLQAVYDGRAEQSAATPSSVDAQLIKCYALPKARQVWRNSEVCQEDFNVVDVANGSFTKANAVQRAVLYRFCITGHNLANNGIAIIEDGKIVAHVVYDGGEDSSIKALTDINGDGLFEIVLGDGGTYQGITVAVAILIEISRRASSSSELPMFTKTTAERASDAKRWPTKFRSDPARLRSFTTRRTAREMIDG
jgi:hypothetical protein